jgi:soluble lytic murein transglycosylase
MGRILRALSASFLAACASPPAAFEAPPPVVAAAAPRVESTALSGTSAPSDTPTEPALDLSKAVPWLSDPRLATARALVDKGNHADAAHAVDAFAASPTGLALEKSEQDELAYLAGTLFARAGAPKQARERFGRAFEAAPALAAYARLRAVESELALGRHGAAIELAGAIDTKIVAEAELDALLVGPLVRLGRLDEARVRTARLFDERTRPKDWPLRAIALARVWLLAPGAERAREAISLATMVRTSAPKGRGAKEADEILTRALGTLPAAERAALARPGDARKIEEAADQVEARQARRAVGTLDRLAKKRDPSAAPSELGCALASTRGKALGAVKRLREASDELDLAVRLCPPSAATLYASARAAQRADLHAVARARFAAVEAAFPKDSLADDARVEGAREARDAGDLDGFRTMLEDIGVAYPSGDRTGDGVFLLASELMERGAWERAVPVLSRGRALPTEHAYHRAGRFTYFLGRARFATGDLAGAKEAYEATLEEAPLSYYAALAASRLDTLEKGRGREAVLALRARAAPPVPEIPASRGESDPRIQAALVLARAGDSHDLEDALDALGVRTRTAPPEVLVLAARLYVAAGDPVRAHALLRTARETEARPERTELFALFEAPPSGAWLDLWKLAYPRPFASEVDAAVAESPIPAALVHAIMREESAFQPRVTSPSDARGLMQVIPPTGRAVARGLGLRFKTDTLFDPAANVRIGTRFLSGLRNRFAFAPALAVPGYNAGPGAPEAWLGERPGWDFDLWVERIPYLETRNYTKRVLGSYFAYDVLYGPDSALASASLPTTLP